MFVRRVGLKGPRPDVLLVCCCACKRIMSFWPCLIYLSSLPRVAFPQGMRL